MASKRNMCGELEIRSTRRIGTLTLMALIAVILLTLLVDRCATSLPGAFAATVQSSSGPWLDLECLETRVREGDDFNLEVHRKYASGHFMPSMRVSWYTTAITADERDYQGLYGAPQRSNILESQSGKMARKFQTLGDYLPEEDETLRYGSGVPTTPTATNTASLQFSTMTEQGFTTWKLRLNPGGFPPGPKVLHGPPAGTGQATVLT